MKGHVNTSGFPLQMAVANAVNESTEHHGWRTRYAERSWNIPSGESEFTDLAHVAPKRKHTAQCPSGIALYAG